MVGGEGEGRDFFSKSTIVWRFPFFHAKLHFISNVLCKIVGQQGNLPVHKKPEGRSVPTWLVPMQLHSNRRYRAPPTTLRLGSGDLQVAAWGSAESVLPSGWSCFGWLTGWLLLFVWKWNQILKVFLVLLIIQIGSKSNKCVEKPILTLH